MEHAPTWSSEGVKVNPTNATVLADTGAIAPTVGSAIGDYEAWIIISTDCAAATVVNLQHRNAANDGNVSLQTIYVPAAPYPLEFRWRFHVTAASQRLRLIPNGTMTGNMHASISWQKVDEGS